ncbi:Beclin 1-associated autophagy-related key regulator [Halotydeus destructor]|nr:Beclin 1-associated autophagy-related key regulator [Halotydeus destructor]
MSHDRNKVPFSYKQRLEQLKAKRETNEESEERHSRKSGDAEGEGSRNQTMCYVCSKTNVSFFCCTCIRNEEFTSSKSNQVLKEHFAEKKLRLFKLLEEKQADCNKIEMLIQKRINNENLQITISQLMFSIKKLKEEINEKQESIKRLNDELHSIKVEQVESRRQPNLKKLQFTKDYIKQWNEKISLKRQQLQIQGSAIRDETNELTHQLKQCIFPIEAYVAEEHETSLNRAETMPLLAYDSASSGSGYEVSDTRYLIVEPWISINDDFSAYRGWVAMNSGDAVTPSTALEHGQKNSGYRTTAALAYLAQIMDVLAGILDIRFPRRLKYSEFYSKSGVNGNDVFLNDTEFAHKIAKLNANAVYLCLSQNVDYNLIHCRQALRNLLTLLNTPYGDLGRRGHVGVDPDFLICLETNLATDLALIDEPIVAEFIESNVEDDIDWEWESIPHSGIPWEQQQSTTNFVSTAASQIWRTMTGYK